MESKVNYTVVGIFVIALISAFIVGIVWLSAGLSTKKYNIYRVYMNESVDGLNVGATVQFNGVQIGTIKDISLNPHNPQQVELLLNIEQGTPITQSTTATLMVQGLTGVSYIGLRTTNNNTALLQAKPGEDYPVIPTAPSLYLRLDTAVTKFSKNFDQLSNQLNAVFDEQNTQAIKQSLQNITQLSSTMETNSKELSITLQSANEVLENTVKASKKFPNLIQNSETTFQTLNNETLPMARQVLDNLQGTTSNLLDASRTIKQNPAVLIRGKTPNTPGPGEK